MIDREVAILFIGKKVKFCWKNGEQEVFSRGILKSVNGSSLLVDFEGEPQGYSLESILWIREWRA